MRTVRALQDGKIIFFLSASFQKPEESLLTHQYDSMPADQPEPTSLPTHEERNRSMLQTGNLSKAQRRRLEMRLTDVIPLDIRYTLVTREAGATNRQIAWIRPLLKVRMILLSKELLRRGSVISHFRET